jgi:hypothetical protein
LALRTVQPQYLTKKNVQSHRVVLLNAVTSPAVDETTKTIFEGTYGQPPDCDALPPVGCSAVRLLEKQHRKDFRFGLTNQPGIFLGYASSDNPRYKFLHTLLGRSSDAIDDADNPAFDDAVEVRESY